MTGFCYIKIFNWVSDLMIIENCLKNKYVEQIQ